MTGSFTVTLFAATLLAGAAVAQTQPQPGSENTQAPPAYHNNMLPAVHRPAMSIKHRKHRPAAAHTANNTGNSSLSSSNTTKPSPQATPSGPDQGKPGTQHNTTNMHTPGSENPADTGPGAPKT